MKKITIMALHLGYGGIEKAISDFANSFSSSYDIEIVSTYKLYDKPVNKLNENIKVKYLMPDLKPNKKEFSDAINHLNIIKIIKEGLKSLKILKLRKKLMINYIKECDSDIIISTRDFHNSILGKYGSSKSIKIGWEHNHHNNDPKYFRRIVKSVRSLDYFILVSEDLRNDYAKVLKNYKVKVLYIPNMINIKSSKKSDLKSNNLITVSRISVEKGIFDLVDVVKIVKESIPNVTLNLIGDGPLYDKVESYIKQNDLSRNINLLGFKKSEEVYEYLEQSSLYVMTSYTESFGISLLESFSLGVPAIAFDSAQGACNLINENNGFLIKNRDKKLMASKIVSYLNDKELKNELSKTVNVGLDIYKSENVKKLWKEIL